MKFNFKIQPYQTDAVQAVISVFKGQIYQGTVDYLRDMGLISSPTALSLMTKNNDDGLGYKNNEISLDKSELLENIHHIQQANNIKLSKELIHGLGACQLDIEMETGTGKTYVYIKTMFELNKQYGFTKFIVVVPSIAIREGVKKSFEMTEEHFFDYYGKTVRYFVYNSSKLNDLNDFSRDNNISVMIINTQAFATSLKEDGRSKESRIIYDKRDDFQSRKPIDVISANRPILILDEPQKMGGDATQKALKNFKPLFTLNYSATHKKSNNLIYVLDALEAYNQKLVKKIEVKGFEVKNLIGTNSYLYLDGIELSPNKPPMARIEMEIQYKSGIKREIRKIGLGDDLFFLSHEMEQYKGFSIADIDHRGKVYFTNGEVIEKGELIGDNSEAMMRRVQIRETIISHFEKEEKLFNMGIKTLSLFFIDEVAKYRQYDNDNNELLGEYGKIFEEEYLKIYNEKISLINSNYQKYLQEIEISKTHKGYFSIDKTGKSIDSTVKRGSDFSEDISAYDLILKNKERLLSFDEPTRFIFSHSALREGWDNPNVFQICTLKHSDNVTAKRQEVGRGLRICVNKAGNRMDLSAPEAGGGTNVHDINLLTIIASESYKNFVAGLQEETKATLYDRPTKATIEYFEGKNISLENGEIHTINKEEATEIFVYLRSNRYVDSKGVVQDSYRNEMAEKLAPLPEEINKLSAGVHTLVQAIFDEKVLEHLVEDGNKPKILNNELNDNFHKAEFQALWKEINRKYAYTVQFDSDELVKKAIKHINANLKVSELSYTLTKGSQTELMNEHEIARNASFESPTTKTKTIKNEEFCNVEYDLIGKIALNTTLTRKTATAILCGIDPTKFSLFAVNPEEFITKVSRLIIEQKATMIVEHISYNQVNGNYESSIFTQEKPAQSFDKAFCAKKHIQDYVFTDGLVDKSIERTFAEDLDKAEEVCVYAKLPRGFYIPTPIGNYSPDWAIAFHKDTVKHIFFVAETKGSMDSMSLRAIESAKIACAKKLFNELSTDEVRYHEVASYEDLLNVMESIN